MIAMTVKACSKNITGRATPVQSEKINLEVPAGLSFQGLPSFFGKKFRIITF